MTAKSDPVLMSPVRLDKIVFCGILVALDVVVTVRLDQEMAEVEDAIC